MTPTTTATPFRSGKGDGWLRSASGGGDEGGGGDDGGDEGSGCGLTVKGMSASRQQAVLQQFKVGASAIGQQGSAFGGWI